MITFNIYCSKTRVCQLLTLAGQVFLVLLTPIKFRPAGPIVEEKC